MRASWLWTLLAPALLCLSAMAADQPQNLLALPCTAVAPTGSACNPSKDDLKKADSAFSKALKLEKEKRLAEAYEEFDAAARLAPRNVDYLTALAVTRQELVSQHVRKGNEDLEKGLQIQAQAEFRNALDLDPGNTFAQQRLQESLNEWAPRKNSGIKLVKASPELHLIPSQEKHAFHFRGDSHQLLTQVANAFGVAAELDDSVLSRRVHFDLDETDFYTAMDAANDVTGTFWSPISEKQLLVAKDTPENHRLYDRMAVRTFSVASAANPNELQQVVNMLRIVFEIRYVQQEYQSGQIIVRAPVPMLDAVTRFLENLSRSRPQVMLDVQIFEIDHQLTREIGLHIPDTFNLFNIPAAALASLAGLGGQNIQSLSAASPVVA